MISKQQILNSKNYKPKFLLSWAKYLTYNELEKIDMLEAYDADILKHLIKNSAEWDKNVIKYNEDNLKKTLCILLKLAYNDLNNDGKMSEVYSDDIKVWLDILGNKDIVKTTNIKEFYDNIAKYYGFEIC